MCPYIPPVVLQSVCIGLEVNLLGSVIDNIPAKGIESSGQVHHDIDYTKPTFSTSWEETGHV